MLKTPLLLKLLPPLLRSEIQVLLFPFHTLLYHAHSLIIAFRWWSDRFHSWWYYPFSHFTLYLLLLVHKIDLNASQKTF